jgi:ribonuclease P protein component
MLAKKFRLVTERDFDQVHKRGRYIKGKFLYLKSKSNILGFARFGFLISNKISKKSTVRNLMKRRMKAVVYRNINSIIPSDVIMGFYRLPKPLPLSSEIEKEIIGLLQKFNLIKK